MPSWARFEVGLITPPFGMIPFAMAGVLGNEGPVEKIFRGSVPFVATMVAFIGILFLFPDVVTWLPELAR